VIFERVAAEDDRPVLESAARPTGEPRDDGWKVVGRREALPTNSTRSV
jgi:hypothetical protein